MNAKLEIMRESMRRELKEEIGVFLLLTLTLVVIMLMGGNTAAEMQLTLRRSTEQKKPASPTPESRPDSSPQKAPQASPSPQKAPQASPLSDGPFTQALDKAAENMYDEAEYSSWIDCCYGAGTFPVA